MLLVRLALYTCLIYLASALFLEVAIILLARWTGSFAWGFYGRMGLAMFTAFWGFLWLCSFLISTRIVFITYGRGS